MVRIHIKKRKENLKKTREIVDLHPSEVSLLIKKLYHVLNKADVCAFCGKKSEFIRVTVDDMTKVRTFKICRQCLVKS